MRRLVSLTIILAAGAYGLLSARPAAAADCVPPSPALVAADAAEARQKAATARSLALAAQAAAREAARKGEQVGSYVQNGYGMFVGRAGEQYQGQIQGGQRNGYGVDVYPNGDRYEGQDWQNQKYGWGIYLHHNGERWEGQMNGDREVGWGMYFWPDGRQMRRYEGAFACDKPYGPGVAIDSGGDSHAGIWRDGTLVSLFPSTVPSLAVVPPSSERPAAGSEAIQLERDHGTYMVPVRINGSITLPFVLDSGASDVAIPADVFLVLLRTHTVSQTDFIGRGVYVLANGSQHASERFMLHEVEIGNHVIRNVVANVAPVKGDPLIGQSFLSKLPGWAIDNRRHILILGRAHLQ